MGYIHDVEKGLRVLLVNTRPDDREAIVRFCKDKILESYHNGMAAAKNSAPNTNSTANTPAAPKPRKFARRQ